MDQIACLSKAMSTTRVAESQRLGHRVTTPGYGRATNTFKQIKARPPLTLTSTTKLSRHMQTVLHLGWAIVVYEYMEQQHNDEYQSFDKDVGFTPETIAGGPM